MARPTDLRGNRHLLAQFAPHYLAAGAAVVVLALLAGALAQLPGWDWTVKPLGAGVVLALLFLAAVVLGYEKDAYYLDAFRDDLLNWHELWRDLLGQAHPPAPVLAPEPPREIEVHAGNVTKHLALEPVFDDALDKPLVIDWPDADWFYDQIVQHGHSKSQWVRPRERRILLPRSGQPVTYAVYTALLAPLVASGNLVGRSDRVSGWLVPRDAAVLKVVARAACPDGIQILPGARQEQ